MYTSSNRLRAAAFLSFGAVVGGTAGRGEAMEVGDAATGAIVGRKTINGRAVERLALLLK